MKFNTFLFCALAVIFFAGLASAGVLEINSLTYPSTALPGTDVTVNFNVNYSGSLAQSVVNFSQSTTNIGSWKTLPSVINVSNNSVPVSFSAVLSIPQLSAGIINAVLRVEGSAGASDAETITITINQSSSLSISTITSLTRTQNATINVTNTGNTALTNINLTATSSNSELVPRFSVNNFNLASGASQLVSVSLANVPSGENLGTITIQAKDLVVTSASDTVQLSLNPQFCKNNTIGDLDISDFDISNNGEGDDDLWNILDEIEIEVEVENNGDSSISDVQVEIRILDSDGNDVTDEFDLDDDIIEIGKIRDDESEIATFLIQEVPSDIAEGDYKILIKAYEDGEEDSQCDDNSASITSSTYQFSVERQYDEGVVVRNKDLDFRTVSCGSYLDLSFDIFNVGENKEESVLVLIQNRELGISRFVVVSDLRADEKEEVQFNIFIPQNLTKDRYTLEITTFFDYDEDEDVEDLDSYDQNSYDDLDESYRITLNVEGCSSVSDIASITASLKSDAKIGSEMVIETVITNTASTTKDFVVTATGYDSWASIQGIEPQTVTLLAGASQTVLVKLKPTKSGTQTFTIQALSGSSVSSQSVQVTIEGKTSLLTGAFAGMSNSVMYALIVLVVILILIVLIVIIRVALSSSKSSSEF